MSGLIHLRAVAKGIRPLDDGLLGNARCAWGGTDLLSEEAVLAAFAARPINTDSEVLAVETAQCAALIGPNWALVADLYDGRIGRLWRVGEGAEREAEPHVDVAFDPDMRQERGDLFFRPEDHPDLLPEAIEPLLAGARGLVERGRMRGKLRVRAFAVRAFGDGSAGAALFSIFALGNETVRTAGFSYAVVGAGAAGSYDVTDEQSPQDWTPRL
jgi:hypothetical protein